MRTAFLSLMNIAQYFKRHIKRNAGRRESLIEMISIAVLKPNKTHAELMAIRRAKRRAKS